MSNYLLLRPVGEGTEHIEQFHSFFYRYSALHATTMIPMARHLEEWWNRTHESKVELNDVFLYKANRLPLCGYGHIVESYVRVVSAAANHAELYRTTLMPIRDASDSIAHGALRRGRAWCPACMYWAERRGEIYYDRLLWAIAAVERCPEHQVALVNTCTHCGVQQLAYHSTAGMTKCAKCLKSLVQTPKSWLRITKPSFGERDCRELVSAISSGALHRSTPKAFSLFSKEARSLAHPMMGYKKDLSLRGSMRTWRKETQRPQLSTMLKRCHISGVKLIDVLSDPIGAAHSIGLLIADNTPLPTLAKPRRSEELLSDVRRRLIEALANFPSQPLVPLPEFARSLGVSVGFINYRVHSLNKVYKEEYKRQVREEKKKRKRLAKAELTHGRAFLRYMAGEFRSQDELVDYLCERCHVRKNVARLLVGEVQKTHLRIKYLSELSCLSVAQRTMLTRGIKDGYLKKME